MSSKKPTMPSGGSKSGQKTIMGFFKPAPASSPTVHVVNRKASMPTPSPSNDGTNGRSSPPAVATAIKPGSLNKENGMTCPTWPALSQH